jgi:hypothetical protein
MSAGHESENDDVADTLAVVGSIGERLLQPDSSAAMTSRAAPEEKR